MPLTQNLHGVGSIDHHYIELTFVLASLWAGLRFFSAGSSTTDAVVLGMVLGIAPAFHNGLFILQIPMLACVFALWSRQMVPPRHSLKWLAGTLIAITLLVALPSTPFRQMQFEFWTLSWFHLYVAVCSGMCLMYFGWRSVSRWNLGLLVIFAMLMVLPIFTKLLLGSAFLAGDLILLDRIEEVKSPVAHLMEPGGVAWVTSKYSWLIFLAPVYVVLFAVRAWRNTEPASIYFSIFAVFGTLLMLTQYRLHPFGSWVLLLGSLLYANKWRSHLRISHLAASAAALLVMVIALQPPLRNQLFISYAPGGTTDYAASRSLFSSLAAACSKQSGAVLSYSDDGHYIRYHTDCSVLTNNFLLTPLHEKKILEASVLLEMTPEQFLLSAPHIKYVFVRMNGVFEHEPSGWKPAPVSDVIAHNSLLFVALTFSVNVPEGFRLIDEVRVEDERDFAYARVFEVVRNN